MESTRTRLSIEHFLVHVTYKRTNLTKIQKWINNNIYYDVKRFVVVAVNTGYYTIHNITLNNIEYVIM